MESYLQIDTIPEELIPRESGILRVPTEDEVQEILAPWRSQRLRQLAARLLKRCEDDLMILRTDYSNPEGNDMLQDWIEVDRVSDSEFHPENLWWRILNEPSYFDFGEKWDQVLHILPEIVVPNGSKAESRKLNERIFKRSVRNRSRLEAFQWVSVRGWPLVVADKESFDTQELRVLFLDGHGYIVRHSRVEPCDMAWLKETKEMVKLQQSHWWEAGEVGEKYRPDGEMGRTLNDYH